jgi:hypothetical protein
MIPAVRFRFWLEIGMATFTAILFVITLVWPEWIEMVFHFSPDEGDGSFERLIVGFFLLATIILSLLGRYEWKIAQRVAKSQSG